MVEQAETANVSDDVSAFNIRYKAGNLDIGAAYQENAQQNALGALGSTNEYSTVAGAYNFGAFRVSGGWNQAKTSTNLKANSYTIGANAPVGAWDFSLGYSTGKSKLNGNTTQKGDALSAGVVYNMSKRTRLKAVACPAPPGPCWASRPPPPQLKKNPST